ncbi:MAG: rod shape-determining protein MreC [Candidatus Pacebacteria bacterium]|nr:rod shape-determining protein MreC [Candidatus Paceibacterota bacterium]
MTLIAVKGSFPQATSSVAKTFLSVFKPVFSAKNKIFSTTGRFFSGFGDNAALKKENEFLKEKTKELESKNIIAEEIFKENKILNEVLNHVSPDSKMAAALILERPGYGIYDSLIIDSGADNGIKEGNMVTAFGNVLLGRTFDVASGISKVRLISYPGEEINVSVGGRFAASAKGVGGVNMEINIPKNIEVFIGDNVFFSGIPRLFLGVVESIDREPAGPFQKILFRLPVNLNEINHVFILIE